MRAGRQTGNEETKTKRKTGKLRKVVPPSQRSTYKWMGWWSWKKITQFSFCGIEKKIEHSNCISHFTQKYGQLLDRNMKETVSVVSSSSSLLSSLHLWVHCRPTFFSHEILCGTFELFVCDSDSPLRFARPLPLLQLFYLLTFRRNFSITKLLFSRVIRVL